MKVAGVVSVIHTMIAILNHALTKKMMSEEDNKYYKNGFNNGWKKGYRAGFEMGEKAASKKTHKPPEHFIEKARKKSDEELGQRYR